MTYDRIYARQNDLSLLLLVLVLLLLILVQSVFAHIVHLLHS